MAEVIRMPKMSDTMTEGVIATWLKKIGDTIKSGDILAEVETDKATMELESYESGTLLYIGVLEKQTIPVNGVLAIIGKADENITDLLMNIQQEFLPKGNREEDVSSINSSTPNETTTSSARATVTTSSLTNPSHTIASPLAKKMAQIQGYDLATISGTGPGSRIIKRDIASIADKKSISNDTITSTINYYPQEAYELIPISQMRKTIAKRLIESKSAAPHFYLTVSINMDKLVASRTELNQYASVKITFNDIIIKAVSIAIKKHLQINTAWLGDNIRYNKHIHIGVAIALEEGLVVPVIKFADNKSLSEIATEVKTLYQKAHNNQLQPTDWEGNTFTISNLGMLGIESFTAIINPPAACILAIGEIQHAPIIKSGNIVPGYIMKATLSCDHRVVDGAVGATFLKTLKGFLEDPLRLLV